MKTHKGLVVMDEIDLNNKDEICSICQEKIEKGVVLYCNHIFHKKCLCEWNSISMTCPLCRKDLKKKNIDEIMIDEWKYKEIDANIEIKENIEINENNEIKEIVENIENKEHD